MLTQLTFKAPGSKTHCFYKLMEFMKFFEAKCYDIILPYVNSVVQGPTSLPSLCMQHLPFCGQPPSAFLTSFSKLSDATSSLYLVVEIVGFSVY